ncbi:MAG: glycosyltransferase [candidate division KSB1 bacterium]|nr:glycosyltransferase [candidate division KSB1 bacterium]
MSEQDVVIGIMGRLQRAKGYAEFLHMAAQLKPRYPQCRFLMIGEASRGEEEEASAILDMIPALGLQDRVHWLGFRHDVPDVLAALDIFVFPSHAEAFGLVLIEAMAMRKPVVSSRCDGVLDIVEDRKTGLLVPPKNVDQLVKAVVELIDDPSLRERMGRAGRQRVEAYFNQEKMLQRLKEIYAKTSLAFN